MSRLPYGARLVRCLAHAASFLYPARDPRTMTAAVGLVLLAAVMAAAVPARRSSRVDPVAILRAE